MSRSRLTNLMIVIAINVFYGMSVGTIDNWGHIGGFIGGVILGWLLCPFYQVEAQGRWRAPCRRSQLAALRMARRAAGQRA